MPIVSKRRTPSYVTLEQWESKMLPNTIGAGARHVDPEPDPEIIEAKAEKISQSILDKILPRV